MGGLGLWDGRSEEGGVGRWTIQYHKGWYCQGTKSHVASLWIVETFRSPHSPKNTNETVDVKGRFRISAQ